MKKSEINLLGTKDLMAYLGIGRDKATALMKSSSFPSVRIGKTYCVTLENVQEWLDKNSKK